MLVVDVESEMNSASMVKDSKTYIEIAKFVQAYETIISNPNLFLKEVGEEPIDEQVDILTWDQFVNIATHCDLGFEPVPTEEQLVMYYSYAMQIGSISKEVKSIATVNDVADAQKNYYNFVDDTATKIENQYNKQHEIAENRAREVSQIDSNLSKMKLKAVGFLAGMVAGVILVGLGVFSIFFVNLFGEGLTNFILSGLFVAVGLVLFFILDRYYIRSKYSYLKYEKSSQSIISRSERTNRDDLVLKDKLSKYQEDQKIVKYELADKNKTFDVKNCIDKLKRKNKYYQLLYGNGKETDKSFGNARGIVSGLDDTPIKRGKKDDTLTLKAPKDKQSMKKLTPEEEEHLYQQMAGNYIDPKVKSEMKDYDNKNRRRDERDERDERYSNSGSNQSNANKKKKEEETRKKQEEVIKKTQEAEEIKKQNGPVGSGVKVSFESGKKELFDEDKKQTQKAEKEEKEEKVETTQAKPETKKDVNEKQSDNKGSEKTDKTSENKKPHHGKKELTEEEKKRLEEMEGGMEM